jgi:WS/DGAT/MGAT family acyltransferase
VGSARVFEMVSIPLAEVKGIRAALGGTVNDVVLSVVAGAIRELLLARKEPIEGPLRVMVPVSVRTSQARGSLGNQVAAIFCPLPVHRADPLARLREVSASMADLKERRQAVGAMALTRLGNFAPHVLAALATRLQGKAPWFNLVVTNVPGPQMPLYLLGKKLLACHPLVPLTTTTTISVALLSYNGSIDIGLLGDAELAEDLPALKLAMKSALAKLSKEADAGLPALPGRSRG